MLVKAWSIISCNNFVRNGQSNKAFWKQIFDYFNKPKKYGDERTRTSIEQHWYWLLPQTNEFNQLYNQLLDEHRSDWSNDQIRQHACKLYYQSQKKHFTHEHIW